MYMFSGLPGVSGRAQVIPDQLAGFFDQWVDKNGHNRHNICEAASWMAGQRLYVYSLESH